MVDQTQLTYTQAVELLELHGIKISSECNGLPVIRACAELVKKLTAEALAAKNVTAPVETLQPESPAGKSFTSMEAAVQKRLKAPTHAKPPRMIKELLHVRAALINDGDMFWIKKSDVPPEALMRLSEWVKHYTGKKILALVGTKNDFKHLNGEQKTRMVQKFMQSMTDAERAKVMADYCECGGPPTCQCWNDD